MTSFEKIYEVVKKIPFGKVATYGQIAMLAGNPRWARVVGYALHVNPDPENIRCYRVVNRFGELSEAFAFGGINEQAELLKAEGVEVEGNRVNLDKFLWNGI
ncbi:MAG: MGMT family protein [Oscillospiraceae bacterium]|nr:MGMT family protein [Oscillospiraceae bacterium]